MRQLGRPSCSLCCFSLESFGLSCIAGPLASIRGLTARPTRTRVKHRLSRRRPSRAPVAANVSRQQDGHTSLLERGPTVAQLPVRVLAGVAYRGVSRRYCVPLSNRRATSLHVLRRIDGVVVRGGRHLVPPLFQTYMSSL